MKHSLLLEQYLPLFTKCNEQVPVIDLACGSGRNGLFLVKNDIATIFADINVTALANIKKTFTDERYINKEHLAKYWQVDFEQDNAQLLHKDAYAGVLVFNYLHRPLMAQIKNTIIPGGFIFYETFTVKQSLYGRPNNPDFLLKSGELFEYFSGWKIHHHFEGVVYNDSTQSKKAIAQIIAEKPEGL